MSKLFGHGDLRLWLLKLIEERPRHGYDIIANLEQQFLGIYSPSPGTVYPRLAALEHEGLIEVDREEEGRKVYRLTQGGRDEIAERNDELHELGERLSRSAKDITREIRDDVKSAVRDLRQEVRRAATEVRRDERRAARTERDLSSEYRAAARRGRDAARSARHAARGASHDLRAAWRSLQADLDGFVSDVISAARRYELDRGRLERLRTALHEARVSIIGALEGNGEQDKEKGA